MCLVEPGCCALVCQSSVSSLLHCPPSAHTQPTAPNPQPAQSTHSPTHTELRPATERCISDLVVSRPAPLSGGGDRGGTTEQQQATPDHRRPSAYRPHPTAQSSNPLSPSHFARELGRTIHLFHPPECPSCYRREPLNRSKNQGQRGWSLVICSHRPSHLFPPWRPRIRTAAPAVSPSPPPAQTPHRPSAEMMVS